jgi:hypothetical protein
VVHLKILDAISFRPIYGHAQVKFPVQTGSHLPATFTFNASSLDIIADCEKNVNTYFQKNRLFWAFLGVFTNCLQISGYKIFKITESFAFFTTFNHLLILFDKFLVDTTP